MADKDYTKFLAPDTTGTERDYTKLLKNPKPAPKGQGFIKLPPVSPNVEKMMNDTSLHLQKQGYDADMLDALMVPVGALKNPMVMDTVYRDIKPVLERNVKGVEEALKLSQNINEQLGVQPTFMETEALTSVLQRFSKESLEGVSEAHKWWMETKRKSGDKAAETYSGTMLGVGLGMALLDSIDHFDKAGLGIIPGKLDVLAANIPGTKAVPKDEMHDIENRVIPPLVLEDARHTLEFNTSTSAALWVWGQKIYGFGERRLANVLEISQVLPSRHMDLSKINGTETLDDFIANLAARGKEREEMALGQIPPLVSALGVPSTKLGSGITWMEIAERKLGLEQEFDSMYKWMGDHGKLGDITMGLWALGNGALDAIIAPSTVVAGFIGKVPAAATKVVRKIPGGQAKLAQLATERAHSTKRLDDAFGALEESHRHYKNVEAKYNSAIKENIRATGEAKVPADLWRRLMLARRQLNNNKQLLDTMKDPTQAEILMETPRRNPLLLPEPAAGADDATREIHKYRKEWLETGPTRTPQWEDGDLAGFQQRKVFGPDDTEQAAYGLEAMIKTGGDAMDDVTLAPIAPEYHVTPARGPIETIDWTNVPKIKARGAAEQRFVDSISGKGLPEKPGQPKFDVQNSSIRMLLQQEDIIRRNLGTARQLKNKANIKIHTKNLKEIRTVIDKVKNKGLSKESLVYDDIFMPADQPTIMNNAERFNRWIDLAGDRVMRSLYPGSLQIKYWDSKMGQLHALTRYDPARYYEAMSPETWNTIRQTFLREAQANASWTNKTRDLLTKAGVLKTRNKFDPRTMFHEYDIDHKQSEILFDMLNTKKTAPEFHHMREVAPKGLLKAHDELREIFDVASDMQGIKGDDYLEGYINHVFPKSAFDRGQRPMAGMGLPRDVELFAAHLFKRRGNEGYRRDTVAALELYGRFMHRKMYREPLYGVIKKTGDEVYQKTGNSFHRYYADYFVRQLEGKPGFLGEMVDAFVGSAAKSLGRSWEPGTIERKLMALSGLVHTSMLGGNPRYGFMQMSNAMVTTQSRYGMLRTLRGLFAMGTKEGQALAKEAGTYQSFIDVLESPVLKKLSTDVFEKWPAITPFGVMSNGKAEMMARGMTFHAARDLHLSKAGFSTWEEAVEAGMSRSITYEALKASEEVNHMFGALGRNPVVTRTLGQGLSVSLSQFLSFIPKQTDELLSQAMRDPGALAKYLMISGWASKIAAEDLGIDITEYVGLGYLPNETSDIASPGVDLIMTLVEFADAHNSHDLKRVARAQRALLESVTNVIPAKIQATSLAKMMDRMVNQELRKSTGEKLRDLDFAGETGLERVRPESDTAPGIGGELLPTILQQRNFKERLLRKGLEASRKEDQRFLFNLQTTLTDFANAVESGDMAAAEKLEEEITNTFKRRLGSGKPIQRAMEARSINEVVRYWHPKFGGDKKLLDRRIETLRRYGISPEGEQ